MTVMHTSRSWTASGYSVRCQDTHDEDDATVSGYSVSSQDTHDKMMPQFLVTVLAVRIYMMKMMPRKVSGYSVSS